MSNSQGLMPESLYVVTVDDERVTCTPPGGAAQSMAWQDVQAVLIETNDLGPFEPDVFWVIVGAEARCIVPQGATGEQALLAKLQALPNFDNEALIEAMSSTENRVFACWRRQQTPA